MTAHDLQFLTIPTAGLHPIEARATGQDSRIPPAVPIQYRRGRSTRIDVGRKCGVCAIDLRTGRTAAFLWFEAGCAELFDVQTLPGMRFPSAIGFQDETVNGIMVAPKAAWEPGVRLPLTGTLS